MKNVFSVYSVVATEKNTPVEVWRTSNPHDRKALNTSIYFSIPIFKIVLKMSKSLVLSYFFQKPFTTLNEMCGRMLDFKFSLILKIL